MDYIKDIKKSKCKKNIKYVLLSLVALILISSIYHNVMLRIETKKIEPPGQLIKVNGHKMHIYGEGEQNKNVTVVFTCGSGTPTAYTDYSNIQPIVSKITRTCVYDRPGYGWSEDTDTPRSTQQIVDELRTLLISSGEKPPYLFVAHSMGAMEVLLYTHQYPEEVKGLVLVDGTSPFKHLYHDNDIPMIGINALRLMNITGLVRITAEFRLLPLLNKRLDQMSPEMREIEKIMTYNNLMNEMVLREGDSLLETAKEMEGTLDFGDIPLVVFTADSSLKELPGWQLSQNSLLELSTNSDLVVVEDTDHISILHDYANDLANIIIEMLDN